MEPDKQPLHTIFKFLRTIKEYILVLGFFASIFVGAVALVVTYRFAPVFESINDLTHRVQATETIISNHSKDSEKVMDKINEKFDDINKSLNSINTRLSRIEGKLEK